MSAYAEDYTPGDRVRVIDGPFSSFVGLVETVDAALNRLAVTVTIFGRPAPIYVHPWQIETAR